MNTNSGLKEKLSIKIGIATIPPNVVSTNKKYLTQPLPCLVNSAMPEVIIIVKISSKIFFILLIETPEKKKLTNPSPTVPKIKFDDLMKL